MTKYLLDTNVVSELRKPKPHGAVIAWIAGLRDDQLYISAVTIGELQRGIERTRRQNAQKALELNNWVDQLEMSSNVLPMDSLCFREWARLMEGKSDHLLEDAMIAATARVHALTVATRNENDFTLLDVKLINPFRPKS
jgi:predicted nucleic acid-binding protein